MLSAGLAAAAVAVPSASAALNPVVFGSTFMLSGAVANGKAGETVQVLARAYGESKFGAIGTATTTANGHWTFTSTPRITTAYQAVWHASTTATITAHVTPRLGLALHSGVLTVTARTANPLRGHSVVVQLRQQGTPWHTVRIVVLGPASRATVPFTAPHGVSEIRLYISTAQAGAGYIGGVSGVLVYRNG
ncbi:MAG TPA: hypothetical protein VFU10_02010 [Gaiellaceae bacterium]|nr:hypothetical protein [Gaiellaceae bacterium]